MTGTAFYVYGVLSQSDSFPGSTADIAFYMDNELGGTFSYTPPGLPGSYVYNSLLWHTASLPYEQHTFALHNGMLGGNVSLLLLDYVVYTR